MEGTAALRSAAPRWSLAGDQQLLDILQDIHQRIISKCNETNKRLEEMSKSLRDASVNLQNVNNKFLALSNTQFVESRVYEDDADVAPPTIDKEPPKTKDLASDLTKLKQSLQILESYHEPLLIVRDSDSDTDSDDNDDRLVLKPKDLYADRPLPYIIGSQAWRSKWHAGLIQDESDSDSSASKVEQVEQYSESEEERNIEDYMPDRNISTSTPSLQSEAPVSVSPVRPSPAAVAADLARRLGGDVKIPEREPVYTQPENVPRKLYKPQEPLATTIFPDEPPPLDDQSSDDDIFAELHKSQPKTHSDRVEDLFDFNKPSGLEEALFGTPKVQTNKTIDKPPLFSEESEPEIPETQKTVVKEQSEESVKKPIGGISLFGTNKHAESIGAAILKRNRRKSSTSGDESNTEEVNEVKPVKKEDKIETEVKKERDIFDDLFAKSEKLNKKKTEVKPENLQTKPVQPKEVKKDIFSDIFDDIDDIFSSDIVVQVKPSSKNEKPLFSDDDDLFAEVSKAKKDSELKKATSDNSDLFSNVTPKAEKVRSNEKTKLIADIEKNNITKENKVIKEIKEAKSIFDSDSDDGLFTNVTKDVKTNIIKQEKPLEHKLKDNLFDDDDDDGLFAKSNAKPKIDVAKNIGKATDVSKKALFDSDDELFKDTKNVGVAKPIQTNQVTAANIKDKFETQVEKFDKELDKSDTTYSINVERSEIKSTQEISKTVVQPKVTDRMNNEIDDSYVPPIKSQNESTTPSHDSFDDEDDYTFKPTIVKNNVNDFDITQNSDKKESNNQISEDVFDKPNEGTHLKGHILRTTRIASEEEKIPETTKSHDDFNDSDDDLFKSKPTIPENTKKYKQDELLTAVKSQIPDLFSSPPSNDIFSDVFDDVPPIFEKPKEPKKSKNVNALFDDDSDDEALFFKKNDVITDEKPDFSPSDERFGIFNDEPPAIDVDFTQKSCKKEGVTKTTQKSENLPTTLDKTDSALPKLDQSENTISKSIENDDVLKKEADTTDNTAKEPKKIGKLKPMNININVNSLLPGASPKKKQIETLDSKQDNTASNEELHKYDKVETKITKSISFDDPEILDNKISKERAKIQVKRRPSTRRARKEAARKSAIDFTDSSFDSSNDNSVKDEVKEKVVKTVYILNDDDIFGSDKTSKSVEPTKKHLNIVDSDEELFKKPESKTENNQEVTVTNENKNVEKLRVEKKSSLDSDEIDTFSKESETTNIANDEVDIGVSNEEKAESTEKVVDNERTGEINVESVSKPLKNTSLLDSDEDDIFRPSKKTSQVNINEIKNDSEDELFKNPPKTTQKVKQFVNSDDDDDLFKTKSKESKPVLKTHISSDEEDLFKNKGIGTLGKDYKKDVKDTHNIFDDFPSKSLEDTTEIKQSNATSAKQPIVEKIVKNEEKTAKKSILDDLSDEDDLFKSKTKLLTKKDKSLFGDDDDDDLFGTKPVKDVKPAAPVAPPVKETKTAKPVFVDPLSLFGDED